MISKKTNTNPQQTSNQRLELRQRRRSLSSDQQALAAFDLFNHISRLHLFQCSRRIACYLPNDGEIDPGLIIDHILRRRKICYLPVLSRIHGNKLLFAPVTHNSQMGINKFGIPEPIVPYRNLVNAKDLDLVLLPVVGFDVAGNRIGMGGGFYDRSLQFMRFRHRWKKPRLVGIAHDMQKVNKIEAQEWDIPLQTIVTDKNIYLVNE